LPLSVDSGKPIVAMIKKDVPSEKYRKNICHGWSGFGWTFCYKDSETDLKE
jgi:hypothetical protein